MEAYGTENWRVRFLAATRRQAAAAAPERRRASGRGALAFYSTTTSARRRARPARRLGERRRVVHAVHARARRRRRRDALRAGGTLPRQECCLRCTSAIQRMFVISKSSDGRAVAAQWPKRTDKGDDSRPINSLIRIGPTTPRTTGGETENNEEEENKLVRERGTHTRQTRRFQPWVRLAGSREEWRTAQCAFYSALFGQPVPVAPPSPQCSGATRHDRRPGRLPVPADVDVPAARRARRERAT